MLYTFINGLGVNFTVAQIICIILCAASAYLLGSLNFGIIFSRLLYKEDVRASGSGNAGSTNMLRTYGKKAGFMTFGGDCLKTAVAIGIGFLVFYLHGMFIAGIACMIGHSFPVFFKFKGGKGVACFAILVLITSITMGMWYLFVILFLMFAVILFGTKFVSLGSVVCSLLYPVLFNRFVDIAAKMETDAADVESILGLHVFEIYAVFAALFVVFLHRTNIARLMKGQENKTNLFKKKNKENGESK
ncbi:MAG: glycerol-3-phosphate 1-O-acyltransferase PlsY [Clostridia bacterium]|nr:glycerol-3-phosphate 1-O-acyltransferase PlsY [Clostridia bacterium]